MALQNQAPACRANLNLLFFLFSLYPEAYVLARASAMCHILSCFLALQMFSPLHSQTAILTSPHFFLLSPHPSSHYFLFIIDICLKSFYQSDFFAISHLVYTRLSPPQQSLLYHLSYGNCSHCQLSTEFWIPGECVYFLHPCVLRKSFVPDTQWFPLNIC